MKKTFFLILTVMSMLLVSCSPSIDSLIDKYEKAAEKGDLEKMIEIADEIDEQLEKQDKDLTIEQAARMAKIATNIDY